MRIQLSSLKAWPWETCKNVIQCHFSLFFYFEKYSYLLLKNLFCMKMAYLLFAIFKRINKYFTKFLALFLLWYMSIDKTHINQRSSFLNFYECKGFLRPKSLRTTETAHIRWTQRGLIHRLFSSVFRAQTDRPLTSLRDTHTPSIAVAKLEECWAQIVPHYPFWSFKPLQAVL